MRGILIIALLGTLSGAYKPAIAGGHACKSCGSDRCCADETIVIHCCPCKGEKSSGSRFSNTSAPVAQTPSLMPYQAGFNYPMSPFMPMMAVGMPTGGVAPGFTNTSAAAPTGGACDSSCKPRIEQLEKDFKTLTKQVDQIVNAVDRNTMAIEKMLERLQHVPGFSPGAAEEVPAPTVEPAGLFTSDHKKSSYVDRLLGN